jgi:hypothetical protein
MREQMKTRRTISLEATSSFSVNWRRPLWQKNKNHCIMVTQET